MDGGGDGDGGLPAKRAKLSPAAGAGDRRDHISDLPDDLLVLILLRLPTNYAARTSVLSRRWRRVWTRLPVLTFECGDSGAAPVLAALAACAAHGDTDIQSLTVSSIDDAAPEATASWLRLATPLLSGALHFHNRCSASVWELNWELDEEVMVERGAFELPCFKKATKIWFKLGFLGLALPPAGVFDALTVLCLENFRFQGQFSLSYTMCPSLQELSIKRTLGLVVLALNSKSLVRMNLFDLHGFQRLNIVAPGLKMLNVLYCFDDAPRPIANIAAEELEELRWEVPYDPESVCLGKMRHLRLLSAPPISSYWLQGSQGDQNCVRFLKCFPAVDRLELEIIIAHMDGSLLLKEDITTPDIKILSLFLNTHGHVFGASVLQLLTKCIGIRELRLTFQDRKKVRSKCSPNCICDQPPNWRVQDVSMRALEEVEILNFNGVGHEVDFVKLLFKMAPTLKRMRITSARSLHPSLELHKDLKSIANLCPEGCLFQLSFYDDWKH